MLVPGGLDILQEKCNKMSFLLGMTTSVLLDLKHDPFVSGEVKTRLIPFIDRLLSEIDEIYYKGS